MKSSDVGNGIPRVMEVLVAALALVAVSPVLFLAAVAVRISSPGPFLFRQTRVGRGGSPFTMIKFRTMRTDSSGTKITASGDCRITPVGAVLRKLKVDELPELWNVIRGDLSFVGPRPEVPDLVDLNNPKWVSVLRVRPGITDPVTIRLRNEEELIASWAGDPEEFYRSVLQPYKLDGYLDYIRRRTSWSDVGVLGSTIVAVLLPGRTPPPTVDEVRRGWN